LYIETAKADGFPEGKFAFLTKKNHGEKTYSMVTQRGNYAQICFSKTSPPIPLS